MALSVDQMLKGATANEFLWNKAHGQATDSVQDIRQITIDGNVIVGYNKYYFFYEKTYSKEPKRSLGGVIDNLNSYVTFVTPKVKLHFNALSATDYRLIMRLIMEKNEFTVTCWDYINQKTVTFRAYFYPQDYPEIYQYDAEMLAVMDYEVELVGTNAKDDTVNIIYHTNPPESVGATDIQTSSRNYYKNEYAVVGEGQSSTTETVLYDGWRFKEWKSSDGVTYPDGDTVQITNTIVLYAQWTATDTYTLSYDYGEGEQGSVDKKEVRLNEAIGTLPSTAGKKVTVDNVEYEVYTNGGWYYTTSKSEATKVTASTVYNIQGNSTVHQLFDTLKFPVKFVSPTTETVTRSFTASYNLPYGTTDIEAPTYDYIPSGATVEWYDGPTESATKVTQFEVKPPYTQYYGRVTTE